MLSFQPLIFGERRPGKLNLAVLIGEITRVQNAEHLALQKQVVEDIHIDDKRLSDAVHLTPLIFAVRIAYESATAAGERLGGQVQKFARWTAPNGMEFSLQEYAGQLPNGPAQNSLPPKARHLLFDDSEAIALCLTWHWLQGHGHRLLSLDHEAGKP